MPQLDFNGTDQLLPILAQVARFLLPILALVVLFRCVRSMLSGRADPETWGYLVTPQGEVHPLQHWECIIGRAKSSDVQLPYEDVASVHAVVTRNDKGDWHVTDLSRGGGVFLNGKKVEGPEQLVDGDIIRCTKHMVKFATNSEAAKEIRRIAIERGGKKITKTKVAFI